MVIISELFLPIAWLAWQACSEKAEFSFYLKCSKFVEINLVELNSLLKCDLFSTKDKSVHIFSSTLICNLLYLRVVTPC